MTAITDVQTQRAALVKQITDAQVAHSALLEKANAEYTQMSYELVVARASEVLARNRRYLVADAARSRKTGNKFEYTGDNRFCYHRKRYDELSGFLGDLVSISDGPIWPRHSCSQSYKKFHDALAHVNSMAEKCGLPAGLFQWRCSDPYEPDWCETIIFIHIAQPEEENTF